MFQRQNCWRTRWVVEWRISNLVHQTRLTLDWFLTLMSDGWRRVNRGSGRTDPWKSARFHPSCLNLGLFGLRCPSQADAGAQRKVSGRYGRVWSGLAGGQFPSQPEPRLWGLGQIKHSSVTWVHTGPGLCHRGCVGSVCGRTAVVSRGFLLFKRAAAVGRAHV